MKSPKWLEKAVFYEIYPQTFFDSNDDGIGDIKGIIKKINYVKDMGFNAIWLNPCFESTFFDAGYDVSDYKKVAKRYGSNHDLVKLFEKCHELGMHIILDLVPGHTSIKHKWFVESCKAMKNKYSNRFIWTKEMWDPPHDVNWIKGFSEREGSVATNFYSIQPALNYGFYDVKYPWEEKVTDKGPQETIKAIIDICKFWLDKGCDGFRVDMAGWLVKRDPDNLGTKQVWNQIIPEVKKDYPESIFVSEWNEALKSLDCGFDADFLLMDDRTPFNKVPIRGDNPYFSFNHKNVDLKGYIEDYKIINQKAVDEGHYLAMITGNHDTKRIRAWLNNDELKLYFNYLLTCRCLPFIYYGDEIGMKFDKTTKSIEGGYQRTGSRNPMCWDEDKKNLGFSNSDETYIRCFKDKKTTVSYEQRDKNSLLNEVKDTLKFKKDHIAFDNDANQTFLDTYEQDVLGYTRQKGNETIYCYFNPSDKAVIIKTPAMDIIRSNRLCSLKDNELVLLPKTYCFAM